MTSDAVEVGMVRFDVLEAAAPPILPGPLRSSLGLTLPIIPCRCELSVGDDVYIVQPARPPSASAASSSSATTLAASVGAPSCASLASAASATLSGARAALNNKDDVLATVLTMPIDPHEPLLHLGSVSHLHLGCISVASRQVVTMPIAPAEPLYSVQLEDGRSKMVRRRPLR